MRTHQAKELTKAGGRKVSKGDEKGAYGGEGRGGVVGEATERGK